MTLRGPSARRLPSRFAQLHQQDGGVGVPQVVQVDLGRRGLAQRLGAPVQRLTEQAAEALGVPVLAFLVAEHDLIAAGQLECRCVALIPTSLGTNLLVVTDFRVPVLTRNTVQLHVNHAWALIHEGFSYTGPRDRRFRAGGGHLVGPGVSGLDPARAGAEAASRTSLAAGPPARHRASRAPPPTPIGACTSTGCGGVQARPHAVHREACLGAGFGLPACECDARSLASDSRS